MLLESGKKEDAISELEEAYKFNKNKKLRSRIAFLRGQILASLGENEKARESFVTAYKNARILNLK
jgi:predicted negative regulator of RcsB-dependent stress response